MGMETGDWQLLALTRSLRQASMLGLHPQNTLQALGSAEAHSVQSAGLEGHTNGI